MKAKLLIIVILLFVNSFIAASYPLEPRLSLYLGMLTTFPPSGKMIEIGDFVTPSLFGGLGQWMGAEAGAMYQFRPDMGIAGTIFLTRSGDWNHPTHSLYTNANVTISGVNLAFRVNPKLKWKILSSKVRLFAEAGFSIGMARLQLEAPISEVFVILESQDPSLKSNDPIFSPSLGLGLNYQISHNFDMFVKYNHQLSIVNSLFYSDNYFHSPGVRFGIIYHLLHKKRYFY